jgi:hypothetical protein
MKYSAAIATAVAVTSAAAKHRSLRYSKAGKATKVETSYYSGGSYSFSFNLIGVDGAPVVDDDSPNEPPKEPEELNQPIPDELIQPTFPQQVVAITTKETLNDPTSPQARSLHWIMNDDGMALDIGSQEWIQRYIMASFYFATGGGNWDECNAPKDNSQAAIDDANEKCNLSATQYSNGKNRVYGTKAWLSPVSVCEWASTACHDADNSKKGTISQIEFESNGLEGTLIDELVHLSNLQFLLLEKGKLTGNIPPKLGQLPLTILDLDYNELSGEIPDEIYDATTLQQIDLNDNKLTGTISPKIKQLSMLTFFQIDNNQMVEGNIPEEMEYMKKLGEYTYTYTVASSDISTYLPSLTTCISNHFSVSSTSS